MVRKINISKIYKKSTAGVPMTPGRWVNKIPKYREMTRLRMSCGGGMGGSSWYELVDRIDLADLMQKNYLTTKNWEGKEIALNLNYLVKAEQYTLATAKYDSQNQNIEYLMGVNEYNWLIEDGNTIRLIDDYQGWYGEER